MEVVKRHLGSLLVGALVVGGIAYVGARAVTAEPSGVVLAQGSQDEPAGEEAPGRHKARLGLHRAIRGEFVVPGVKDGTFRTVKIDRGLFSSIDGSTVVIKEDDGTTVEIPTSDETRISRDGEKAALEDFREGDHVMALRVDEGDGFVTERVRAISAERWQERQERREQCRANREECRAERRERRAQRMQDLGSENVG